MQEETKEEYLARHRKGMGMHHDAEPEAYPETDKAWVGFKKWVFILLLLLFAIGIYCMFGMMRAN